MISEFFLTLVFNVVQFLLSGLPLIDWIVPTSWVDFINDGLSVVCYFLPMNTVKSIFALIIAFTIFRAVVSVIKSIWDLLPLV